MPLALWGKHAPHSSPLPLWLKVHAVCWMAGEKQGAARSAEPAPTGGAWYEEDAAALLPAEAAWEVSEEEVEAARVRADAALAAEVAAFSRDKGAPASQQQAQASEILSSTCHGALTKYFTLSLALVSVLRVNP